MWIFELKILDADADPGSERERIFLIRNPGWKNSDLVSGMIRIRYPGSATLLISCEVACSR
jgi:hypothetical protein